MSSEIPSGQVFAVNPACVRAQFGAADFVDAADMRVAVNPNAYVLKPFNDGVQVACISGVEVITNMVRVQSFQAGRVVRDDHLRLALCFDETSAQFLKGHLKCGGRILRLEFP